MGHQPLSAPPMAAQSAPPPPSADTRMPWPAPPPGGAAPGGWPNVGPQSPLPQPPAGSGDSQLSDTMERMLRPQGLFQNPQPKPFDWQQPWAAPAIGAGAGAAASPPGADSTMPHPPPAAPGGQYPPPNGGQYPPANEYQATTMLQPGGPTPAGGYPPPSYGQGQYQPDQYGQGQYQPDQYGQGQYGPYSGDQLGPGGPGGLPPVQYGPGPQFGPDGQPLGGGKPPRKIGGFTLPRGPLVPAIVVAVVVVVVVAAIILSTKSSPGSSTASPGSGTSAGAGTGSKGGSSGGSASNAAERAAAVKLSGLLSQSGKDRSDVNAAYDNVQSCGKNLSSDARVFNRSASNRRALLTQLGQLSGRSALPTAMVSDLTSAWQASATVDSDLAQWATAASRHCHNGDLKNSSLVASGKFDSQATDNKQAFATLWNQLAHKDGLPTYTVDQL